MVKEKKKILTIAVLAILLIGAGFLLLQKIPIPSSFKKGGGAESNLMPQVDLVDYSGRSVNTATFIGVPLIINSWASWCPFCRQELEDFAKIKSKFGNQIKIIAVNRSESLKVAKKYSDPLNVSEALVLLLDPNDFFYRAIGGFTMPETIFVDKKGRIVFHKRGPMAEDEILDKINQLINQGN